MDYMFNAWSACTTVLNDGRACPTNNAAERALRAIASAKRASLFVGSDRGGDRAAKTFTLITTCELNDVGPLAKLIDVLTLIAYLPQTRLHKLLP